MSVRICVTCCVIVRENIDKQKAEIEIQKLNKFQHISPNK